MKSPLRIHPSTASLVVAFAGNHLGIKGAIMWAVRHGIRWYLFHAFRMPPLFAKPADLFCSTANRARVHHFMIVKSVKKPSYT